GTVRQADSHAPRDHRQPPAPHHSPNQCERMNETVYYTQRTAKRWHDGDMRKRWTSAGMLVAEQQFRRIIGYRELATLVIAIERHATLVAEKNRNRQENRELVTV